MSFNNISIALNQRLQSYAAANSRSVAWENKNYTPTLGTMYLRPTVLSADTALVGMANSDSTDHAGIFQIDVIAPINQAKAIALAEADAVSNYFSRGLSVTYDGVSVKIGSKSIGVGVREDAWYVVPVFINYQTFT